MNGKITIINTAAEGTQYSLAQAQQSYLLGRKAGEDAAIAKLFGTGDVVAALILHLEQVAEVENITPAELIDRLAATYEDITEDVETIEPIILTERNLDYGKEGQPFDARGNTRDGRTSPR